MEHTLHPIAHTSGQDFTPVPLRPRHDGWSPERQVEFIMALAECGCVGDAAARVGMSKSGAYALLQRPDSAAFRAAWSAALSSAVRLMSTEAFSRSIHGVAVPQYYKGQVVGERRVYNESMTRFLLQHLDPSTYGSKLMNSNFNVTESRAAALDTAVRGLLAAPVEPAGSLNDGLPSHTGAALEHRRAAALLPDAGESVGAADAIYRLKAAETACARGDGSSSSSTSKREAKRRLAALHRLGGARQSR